MLRLEKIELNGFKSFSSPTEFTFGPGITAIVGPNGCGKSNIADALSWVIGEQSTRSLRAEQMGDVIFNGSEARKPLGMAEVSLHLSGPEVPESGEGNGHGGGSGDGHEGDPDGLAVAGARKVLITRRLFRSGESEYLIDGQKSRLRDVQELLAEIRVGSGVYAVIEQGRVDAVLSSRPRERRVLIEEAAGIALYKVRKRQAQAKLEAAEANLLRVNDLVGEIERQINALKRQAARARRYARLSASIDRAERLLFHNEGRELRESARLQRSRRDELEKEESAAAAGLSRADAALQAAREALMEDETRHQAARDALHALDRSLDLLKGSLERRRNQESEAAERIARGGAEIDLVTDRLEQAEARGVSLGADLLAAAEEADRTAAAATDREAALRMDEAELLAAEAQLDAAREDLVSAAGALSECRNEMRRLAEVRARCGQEEAHLDRLTAELEAESAALGARRSEQEARLEAAARRLREVREGAEASARALGDETARREALLLEREERRGRLAALGERIASLEAVDENEASDSGAPDAGAPGQRLKDMLSPPEPLDRAVDAALKGLLRGRLTTSAEEAVAIVAALKSRGRGRAVLIPADGAPPAPVPEARAATAPGLLGTLRDLLRAHAADVPGIAPILDRVVVARDLDAALAARRALSGRDIVTLQGDLLSRDGWIEGGAELPEEAGVMTLKRLLDRLAADAEAVRERISSLEREIVEAEARTAALRAEEAAWRLRDAETGKETEAARLRAESLEDDFYRLALRREAHAGERSRLREDLASVAASLARAAALVEDAFRRHDELQRAVESGSGAVDSMRAALRRGAESLADLRAAAAAARGRRSALQAETLRHAETLADLRQRAEREAADRVQWAQRLQEARSGIAEESAALADRMAERILAEGALASAEAALIERRQSLGGLDREVREARERLDAVRGKIHALALEEEHLSGDRRNLEARMAERGLPSLEAAEADLTDEEKAKDPGSVQAEMAGWKASREAMGPVNLMAMEQYRELEERYAFITAQRRDLDESIRSLRDTIVRINRQSRERFLDAYEKIRVGFSEIFRTLFGGGRADLRLVMEGEADEDVLEAGLEVIAQPPGKRLQSISLLSGGEKALTAIALLFAIFKYSPSPFCLLDEVDAPLDEANVIRFSTLLKMMSAETQFILITHNRRTMETAELLYGVTMEEPGVSRTISVVMASQEDRTEAARTLPGLLASRNRGSGGHRRLPAGSAQVRPGEAR